ncbi:MAG: glycosyltransferase family 10 domain-containing protein, partial [Candidatus Hodarchaeota archaeon]
MLVRLIPNWNIPNDKSQILKQMPGGRGCWGDISFTFEPVEECDFVVIYNWLKENVRVKCPLENIWAIMGEPYIRGFSDWMIVGHDQFNRVYTYCPPSKDNKYLLAHPLSGSFVRKSYDELIQCPIPVKSKPLSWVTSNLQYLPGHKKRMAFLSFLRRQKTLDFDLFGRGINYIPDKWDGLAPYKYSLVIENTVNPHYWTEKVGDCFLAFTLPFYYGCPNLENYFPTKSFIRIDINRPKEAVEIIKRSIENQEWSKRIEAIKESRELLLNKYQTYAFLANELSKVKKDYSPKKVIELKKFTIPKAARIYNRLHFLSNYLWSSITS